MKILALSDLHGFYRVYEWIPRLAEEHRVDVIVLAGDLLGAPEGSRTIEAAQRSRSRKVIRILARATVPVLYIMGNDDWVELNPPEGRLQSIHGRRLDFGTYNFVGYQYSLPFMGGVFEKPEKEIEADIARLEPLMDRRTVLVTHSPAFGVLDLGVLDRHAGSASIRAAVERRSVRAHIHGHIHACFGREGRHFNVASSGEMRAMVLEVATLKHEMIGADGSDDSRRRKGFR